MCLSHVQHGNIIDAKEEDNGIFTISIEKNFFYVKTYTFLFNPNCRPFPLTTTLVFIMRNL